MTNTEILEYIKKEAESLFGEERVETLSPSSSDSGKIEVTIHFPKLTIVNTKDDSHLITDLWVKVLFRSGGKFCDLWGTRTTQTPEEKQAMYLHSHLSRNDIGCWESFCTGESAVTDMKAKLTREFDKTALTSFFLLIEQMVAWESLEGVPYIKINEIANRTPVSSLNLSESQKQDVINTFLSKTESLNYDVTASQVGVNISLDEKQIEELLTEYYKTSSYMCKKIGNQYYAHVSNSNENYKIGETGWEFKGEQLDLLIKPNGFELSEDNLVIHPDLTRLINDYIQQDLSKFLEEKLAA